MKAPVASRPLVLKMPEGVHAPAPAYKPAYTLTLVTKQIDRTTWWKNCDRKQPANVWWLTGGGLNRLATDVEVDLWLQLQAAKGTLEPAMIPKADWFEI